MRLHEADPNVVAYQEIRLEGKENVVCAQMYDKERGEYQREWAQGVPLLLRRGLSVVQDNKVGARVRRAVYDVATEHGQVVIINCHVQGEEGQGVCGAAEDGVHQGTGEEASHRGWALQIGSPEERRGDGG